MNLRDPLAILFDIDGTLLITGGAGAASWRLAFDELYGIPADIGQFTDTGMTDPDVGRKTFQAVLHRDPERHEFTRLLERRLYYLHSTVEDSTGYRVLPGVDTLLPELIDSGYLLGLVTGNVEAAAHIKLHRANLNRFFSFGGYGSDSTDRGELTKIALHAPPSSTATGRPEPRVRRRGHPTRRRRRTRRRNDLRGSRQPQLHRRPTPRGGRRLRRRLADRRTAAVTTAHANASTQSGRAWAAPSLPGNVRARCA